MTVEHVRWTGGFPKIGIRPTIDGRRKGVRESLEVQPVYTPIKHKKFPYSVVY